MRDSFKLEDNYNKKAGKSKANRHLSYLLLLILLILVFIGYLIYYYFQNKVYVSKINDNKNYVYTIMKNENTYQEGKYDKIPKININSSQVKKINAAIIDNYNDVSKRIEYDYYYKFNISENILSLLIAYAYYQSETDSEPIRNFETINIDLRTGKILNDDDILKKYNLTKNQINEYLSIKFLDFYNGLVKNKYFTEKECNYECFMKNRKISDNYLNGVNFYIENKSLIAYKFFYTVSPYNEQYYFNSDDYKFIIKK